MIIVIILWVIDGDPMNKWRVEISIDTVLSILAGLSKACLLVPVAEALGQISRIWLSEGKARQPSELQVLEKASHGTWGAFGLLFKTRGL